MSRRRTGLCARIWTRRARRSGTCVHSRWKPTTSLEVEGQRRRLAPRTENELLRIGQEAITNAIKHASPRRIEVRLVFREKQVELIVSDDGVGFDPKRAVAGCGRFGLVGMRERAAQLGAELEITSEPGRGSRIGLRAPTPD